jgi:hypothetical protein
MAKPMGRFTVPQGPRLNPRIFHSEAACTSFGTRRKLCSLIVIAILSPDLREVEFTDKSRRIPKGGLDSDTVLYGLAVRCDSNQTGYAVEIAITAIVAIAKHT